MVAAVEHAVHRGAGPLGPPSIPRGPAARGVAPYGRRRQAAASNATTPRGAIAAVRVPAWAWEKYIPEPRTSGRA